MTQSALLSNLCFLFTMSSPSGIDIRLSDLNTRVWINLDFLGFVLDTFYDNAHEPDGLTTSKSFGPLTDEEMEELSSYIRLRNWKILIKAGSRGRQFLSCILYPHEQPAYCMNATIAFYNQARSGNLTSPINPGGSGRMRIAGTGHESDGSFKLCMRTLNSQNAVIETHYRAADTLSEFNSRLRNYIMATNDIVLAVGFKIFEHAGNDFAAVVIAYRRAAAVAGMPLAHPIIISHISFGTHALTPQELAAWNAGVVGGLFAPAPVPLVGVGFAGAGGLPAVNAAAAPYILNIPEGLFLMDNADPAMPAFRAAAPLVLANPAANVLGGNIQFNLYHVQLAISQAIRNMYD